jgi:hypothetical protein
VVVGGELLVGACVGVGGEGRGGWEAVAGGRHGRSFFGSMEVKKALKSGWADRVWCGEEA